MSHPVAVVLDLDGIHSIQIVPRDGNCDMVSLGIEGVPKQFGDTGKRLCRSRESVKLVGINLDDEPLAH